LDNQINDELISHYGDIKRNTLFNPLINLQQRGPIIEHIQQFQKLILGVKNILEDNLLDLFMGTLKDNIQHEVHLFEPKYLEHVFNVTGKLQSKNMGTRRVSTNNYRDLHVPSPNPTQPIGLTPQKMGYKDVRLWI
jgi:hypothetical protein